MMQKKAAQASGKPANTAMLMRSAHAIPRRGGCLRLRRFIGHITAPVAIMPQPAMPLKK